MNDVKSLIGSKSFWAQILGLVSLISGQFHFTAVHNWAVDPDSLQVVLNFGGMLGLLLGMIFRVTATKQITTILPPATKAPTVPGAKVLGFFFMLALLVPALGLSGCSPSGEINKVTGALSSKQANQAAQNVKAFTMGMACFVGNISALAAGIEAQLRAEVNTGNALVDKDTNIVYVVTSSICASMGGALTSTKAVVVPATATNQL